MLQSCVILQCAPHTIESPLFAERNFSFSHRDNFTDTVAIATAAPISLFIEFKLTGANEGYRTIADVIDLCTM